MSDKQKVEDRRWSDYDQVFEFWHSNAIRRIDGGSVLDIGCGDGLLLQELGKKGVTDTLGLDVSESGIEKGKSKGLNVVLMPDTTDLNSIPAVSGKKFDHITILEVLEHVFNPADLLMGAHHVMKNDGHLYASTPNFNAVGDRIRTLRGLVPWQKRHGKGHVYWMNVAVFRSLIREAGFEIEEFRSLGYRRGKSFAGFFDWLAQVWPTMFALSFFVHARPRA